MHILLVLPETACSIWSGRSVTGTRVGTVCFALFARFYASWGHSFAHGDGYANFPVFWTCFSISLWSWTLTVLITRKRASWGGAGGGSKFSFGGVFPSLSKALLLLGGAFLLGSFYLLPWVRNLQISSLVVILGNLFVLSSVLSFMPWSVTSVGQFLGQTLPY